MSLQGFGGLSLVAAARIDGNRTLGELQAQRSVALSHERDTASCLGQVGGANHRVDGGLLGEESTDVGVIAVHQNARGAAGTGGKTNQFTGGGQRNGELAGAGESATDLGNGLGL